MNLFTTTFLIFSMMSLAFPRLLFADENFETNVSTEYKVEENGITHVAHTITLKNLKSRYFAKSYILNLGSVGPTNLKAYEAGEELQSHIESTTNLDKITVNFGEKSLGKDAAKTFIVSYDTTKLSKKSGEIWEVSIPKLVNPDVYNEYKVTLNVPETFGEEAFISPEPTSGSSQNERLYYFFDKSKIAKTGVTAGFGKFQVFDFELSYAIENSNEKTEIYEIVLPPDTSIQRMLYEKIDPLPTVINRDKDGNWIAKYNLNSKERVNVKASGKVQVFASPRNFSNEKPNESDLKSTKYWQSEDPEIKEIAARLEGPSAIYKYVSEKLKYNFDKVGAPYVRKGAKGALENPEDSLCMEFTDLFIALARAKGIPAREVNGHAYSLNPEAEPLSLVTNKLHAWPEYWDKDKGVWIPIDPTWASTTGGVDFFNKFDLRHFGFVIHGENPEFPASAGSSVYGDQDNNVLVSFGSLPVVREPYIDLKFQHAKGFPLLQREVSILVENKGPSASYNAESVVLFDGVVHSELKDGALLPFQKSEERFTIPYGFLGTKSPNNIKVVSNYAEMNVPSAESQAVLNQVLVISTILFAILSVYMTRFRQKFN